MVAPAASTTSATRPWRRMLEASRAPARLAPALLAVVAFLILFAEPMRSLAHDWWTEPDAGHGLLLFPVSLWLAWKSGVREDAQAQPWLGTGLLVFAVLVRALGGLAAEFFTQRLAIWLTLLALIVFFWGVRQALRWWLPLTLLVLSIPLPATITNSLAVPLQFQASRMGTALIAWRDIPVKLSGNVIYIPGQRLFVAEACSGLRSLTALIALGVMIGGMWLTTVPGRLLILLLAVPVAIVVNAIRIFLTAFLIYFVSPELGSGFMHLSEGWALFVLALGILGTLAAAVRWVERRFQLGASHA